MDIQPFHETKELLAGTPFTVILIISGVLILSAIVLAISDLITLSGFLLAVGAVGAFFAIVTGGITANYEYDKAYSEHIELFKDELRNQGFVLMKGNPSLYPSTESSLTLQHKDELLECTVHSPVDVQENLFVTCGKDTRSLNQIKTATQ